MLESKSACWTNNHNSGDDGSGYISADDGVRNQSNSGKEHKRGGAMEFFTHHFDSTEGCFLLALDSILLTKNSSLVTSLERSSIVASSAGNSLTESDDGGERFVPFQSPGSEVPNWATKGGYWKATGKDREIYSSKTSALLRLKRTEKKRGEVDNSTRRD
ncbi:hypothetical protein L1887_03869 [Cichorium endivia]|nr:hypothetical protein L1887_03869 [Cichorium endivia]